MATPTERPPAPPCRLGPRRRTPRSLVLAARARGPRGPGLPRGRERLHRGRPWRTSAPARDGIFEEMKARIKETDMSVPVPPRSVVVLHPHRGGQELRHPLPPPGPRPRRAAPGGRAGREEQILLDENALAEGQDYFAVGTAAVSHDHRWLAYRPTERRREVRAPLPAARGRGLAGRWPPRSVPDTGYGLAWSAGADVVFYVRLDEAHAPVPAVAPPPRQRPRRGRPGLRGARPPLRPGHRAPPGTRAFVLVGLHSTNTTEWLAIPADATAGRAPSGHGPPARASSTPSTT